MADPEIKSQLNTSIPTESLKSTATDFTKNDEIKASEALRAALRKVLEGGKLPSIIPGDIEIA